MKTAFLSAVALCLAVGCGGSGGGDAPVSVVEPIKTDPAEALFDESQFNDVRLTLSAQDWGAILSDTTGSVDWRPATFQWKTESVSQVAVQPRARVPQNPKQTFHLKFDAFVANQTFRGLTMLRLNGMQEDASLARDRISYAIFRSRMPAPRLAHCRLYVNGEYRGVYEVEEIIDGAMMRRWFAGPLGNLYEMKNTLTDPYDWPGPNVDALVPEPWEPVPNEAGEHSDVLLFTDVLTRNPSALGTVCDLDTLITYFAVEAVVTDMHGFAGDLLANNHFQYHWPQSDRFYILPWDLCETFGDQEGFPTRDIFENFQLSRLSAIIENDPVLRARYKAKIGEILEADGHPDAIAARVDAIYDQIGDAAHADALKMWGDNGFDTSRQFIKDFAQARYDSLKEQIAEP